jgi:hypothetical protein
MPALKALLWTYDLLQVCAGNDLHAGFPSSSQVLSISSAVLCCAALVLRSSPPTPEVWIV